MDLTILPVEGLRIRLNAKSDRHHWHRFLTKIYVPLYVKRGVYSVGEEHYGNDLMYLRSEVRGRKSDV